MVRYRVLDEGAGPVESAPLAEDPRQADGEERVAVVVRCRGDLHSGAEVVQLTVKPQLGVLGEGEVREQRGAKVGEPGEQSVVGVDQLTGGLQPVTAERAE